MTEHGRDAIANSHELGAINMSRSANRNNDVYNARTVSEPLGLPEPAVVPRSRLRMFAVMAALFVSLSLLVRLS